MLFASAFSSSPASATTSFTEVSSRPLAGAAWMFVVVGPLSYEQGVVFVSGPIDSWSAAATRKTALLLFRSFGTQPQLFQLLSVFLSPIFRCCISSKDSTVPGLTQAKAQVSPSYIATKLTTGEFWGSRANASTASIMSCPIFTSSTISPSDFSRAPSCLARLISKHRNTQALWRLVTSELCQTGGCPSCRRIVLTPFMATEL